ncbi:MAG: hypothetical protein LBV12_09895, partial [Puniceicoccales bacterium]|nr:hypothetical protein [Puniceicoccales bacterium]
MKKNRFPKILLLASLACLPSALAFAQAAPAVEEADAEEAPALDPAAEKAEKIRDLLMPESAPSAAEFQEAIKKAKELGATEQQIIEAEVFHVLISGKEGDLTALANRLEKAAPDWDVKIAFGIRKKELAMSLVYALRAKAALDKNDEKTFRNEAANSLWEEPQLSGLIMKMYQDSMAKNSSANAGIEKLTKAIEAKD